MTPADPRSRALEELGPLADPVRRRLYLFIADQPDAVGRDAAAAAGAVSRPLAAFHLDRLVEAGLLEVEYRRLTGRSGPGAGRPAKLYRPSDRRVEVSLPERRYELAGHVLAAAIEAATAAGSDAVAGAVSRAATAYGRALGEEARARRGDGQGSLDALRSVLAGAGFHPAEADGSIVLRNCPFDALARDHQAVVCGLNLALVGGLVEELGESQVRAALEPAPGRCCVVLHPVA